jgi:hypothetical protein
MCSLSGTTFVLTEVWEVSQTVCLYQTSLNYGSSVMLRKEGYVIKYHSLEVTSDAYTIMYLTHCFVVSLNGNYCA